MKAVLLLVACLAFASAARPAFETEAMAACGVSVNYICGSGNGSSCVTTVSGTTYTVRECPVGTYEAGNAANCWCKSYESPTIGTICNTTSGDSMYATCTTKNPANGDTNLYWFSTKYEGDTCSSTTAFDCLPPRRCVSGKCINLLATGETCWNTTSSTYLSTSCSFKDYCPSSGSERVCTARLAAGADCTDSTLSGACPRYQSCLVSPSDSTKKTCQTPARYWIPAGQAQNTSATDCYYGVSAYNTGDGKYYCVDYNTWKATYEGKSCDSATECGTYGTCACTSATSSVCTWSYGTHDSLVSTYATSIAKQKAFYDAGCDSVSYPAASASSIYCQVQLGYSPSTIGCNSAFSGRAFSAVTIVLSAMVAVFLAKW